MRSEPVFCFKLPTVKAQLGGKIQEVSEEATPDTILYVNICYTDSVIPPLKDNNELADPKDDSTWKLIPFSFTKPVAVPSKDVKKVAVDMDVSKAVHDLFMSKPTYVVLKWVGRGRR